MRSNLSLTVLVIVAAALSSIAYTQDAENGGTPSSENAIADAISLIIPDTASGIGAIPGVGTITDILSTGGLLSHVENRNCIEEPYIPDACIEQLKKAPEIAQQLAETTDFATLLTDDFDIVEFIGNLPFDIKTVCEACSTPEHPKEIVNIWAQKVTAMMGASDADPTCGGMIAPSIGIASIQKLLQIVLASTCDKREDGEYCYSKDVMPKAMQEAGFIDLLRDMDFENLVSSASLAGIMGSLDIPKVCGAFEKTGCCARTMMEITPAFLELTCMKSPLVGTMLTVARGMCRGLTRDTCASFTMPEYTPPPQSECPSLPDMLESFADLKRITDTPYNDCTTPKDACPMNVCELMMCRVES